MACYVVSTGVLWYDDDADDGADGGADDVDDDFFFYSRIQYRSYTN